MDAPHPQRHHRTSLPLHRQLAFTDASTAATSAAVAAVAAADIAEKDQALAAAEVRWQHLQQRQLRLEQENELATQNAGLAAADIVSKVAMIASMNMQLAQVNFFNNQLAVKCTMLNKSRADD